MARSSMNGWAWRVAALAGCAVGAGALVGCSGGGGKIGLGKGGPATVQPGDFATEVPEGEPVKLPKPSVPQEAPKQTPVTVVNIGSEAAPTSASTRGGGGLGGIKTNPNVVAAPGTVLPGNGVAAGTSAKAGAASGAGVPGPQSQIETTVGEPTLTGTPSPGGKDEFVEAKIGQINGRPVFATDILEPLDGTLRAAAVEAKTDEDWQKRASGEIAKELKRQIDSELILSEARSSLTPEQKQGLLHFLQTIQSDLVSQNAGSEVKADEDLKNRTGRSLRKEAEDSRDQALIKNEINLKVRPLVVVSWRDVQNEYERQHAKYNPPAKYHYRLIYTDEANQEGVQKLQGMLDAGTKFEDVAGDKANQYNPGEKGAMPVKEVAGSLGEAPAFHRSPEVDRALKSLSVGEKAGPITFALDPNRPEKKLVAWVHLDSIDQPPGKSLYEAQLEIEQELKRERGEREMKRYFEKLYRRGNVSDAQFAQMVEWLLQIATDRYAPKFAKKTG